MGAYKKKIEEELYKNCEEIISIIKTDVLEKATDPESRAFFLKMIGDYCRYIAESAKNERLESCKQDALTSY
jgi:14-3-3 protein epsilon